MAINDTNTSLPINGHGYLSVSSSVALSTLTANSAGHAYPLTEFPNQSVTITNNSTSVVYICPFGGTCAATGATGGVAIPVATARTINVGGVSPATPTIVSAGTSTVTVEW